MHRTCVIAVLGPALWLSQPAPTQAAPTYDLNLGLRYEDNLTRAEAAADQEHDTAINAGSRVSGRHRLGLQDSLSWDLGMNLTWWTRFEDLSELAGDAALRYRRSYSTAFGAPWLEAAIAATGFKHRDSALRDGGLVRAGLTAGRRFGARTDARLGYAYVVRRAVEDDVFDLEQHETFAQVDVALGPRWLVYSGITLREGELVSSAGVPNPRILASANEVSVAPDAALGVGRSPLGVGRSVRRSYQIDGLVIDGEAGVNVLLGRGVALDLAGGYVQAYAAGDNQYNGCRVNLNLLWQFR